jgi:hypothetical protein
MRLATVIIAGSIVLIGFVASCGYYSTKGRTAGDIKRIAIPYFKNETAQHDIEIDITNNITSGLVKDNTLKVVPEADADAVLQGTIVKYENIPYTFQESQQNPNEQPQLQAQQYRLVIGISVSLYNRKDNAPIWENRKIEAHSDYYLETSTERTYDKALQEVYNDLVEGILNATVQEW